MKIGTYVITVRAISKFFIPFCADVMAATIAENRVSLMEVKTLEHKNQTKP
mgnify:CR=1 FL=1